MPSKLEYSTVAGEFCLGDVEDRDHAPFNGLRSQGVQGQPEDLAGGYGQVCAADLLAIHAALLPVDLQLLHQCPHPGVQIDPHQGGIDFGHLSAAEGEREIRVRPPGARIGSSYSGWVPG